MAGNIDGYFHDNVLVRGSEMAKITNALAGQRSYVIPGYAQEMNITVSGLNVTVQPGMAVIQGYPVVIKQPMTLSLPANSSGYIVITIDKSQEVTFEGDPNVPSTYTWENNQVTLEYVSALITGDLNNDDSLNTYPLARVESNATTVSISMAGDRYNQRTYTFKGNTQCDSEVKSNVSAESNIVFYRLGNFIMMNARVSLVNGIITIKPAPKIFDIPAGYRIGRYTGATWNVPCAVGRYGTGSAPGWYAVAESATSMVSFASNSAGNHYISGSWFTDDPMPA